MCSCVYVHVSLAFQCHEKAFCVDAWAQSGEALHCVGSGNGYPISDAHLYRAQTEYPPIHAVRVKISKAAKDILNSLHQKYATYLRVMIFLSSVERKRLSHCFTVRVYTASSQICVTLIGCIFG